MSPRYSQESGLLVIRPVPAGLLLKGAAVALCWGLIYLAVTPYARKIPVSATVVAAHTDARIVADEAAQVRQVLVRQGQVVEKGAVLLTLSTDKSTNNQSYAKSILAAKEEEQEVITKRLAALDEERSRLQEAYSRQMRLTSQMLVSAQAEAELKRKALLTVEEEFSRKETLSAKGFLSQSALAEQRQSVDNAKAALSAAQRQVLELESRQAALSKEDKESQSRLEQELASLRRALLEAKPGTLQAQGQESREILAPVSGRIGLLNAVTGQAVKPSDLLAAIVSEGGLQELDLMLPPQAVRSVKQGQTVLFRIDAYPYTTFGHATGQVVNVDEVPSYLDSNGVPVVKARARISHAPAEIRLQAGMTAQAHIEGEQKSLLAWMFNPFMKHWN